VLISFGGIAAGGFIAASGAPPWNTVLLASTSGAFLAAAGNIINDVHDADIDRINKPERVIAAGIVSTRSGRMWAAVCASTGILISASLAMPLFFIALASAGLLYLYSARMKAMPLFGNTAVGLLTGLALIYGAWAVGNPWAAIVPALFAFGVNVGREIIKDVEDVRGDRIAGLRTFPLLVGTRPALLLATVLLFIVVVASVLPPITQRYSAMYIPIVAVADIIIIAAVYQCWRDVSISSLRAASTLLKYSMPAGIASFVVGSL